MGFFDTIGNMVNGKPKDPEYKKKQYLLTFLSSKEIGTLEKSYYGKSLKLYWNDEHGIERSRVPSRNELIHAICVDVPLEFILDTFPKLKKRLE